MGFDSYSDSEVGEVWERTKKDIEVSKLKEADSQQEFVESLKKEMESIPKNKQAVQNLLKSGFAERVAKLPETKSFYEIKPVKPKIVIKPIRKPVVVKLKLPSKLARRKPHNKISIEKRGRFRSYSASTVKVSRYFWRGKPAMSFYSLRQKKLITWGLVK